MVHKMNAQHFIALFGYATATFINREEGYSLMLFAFGLSDFSIYCGESIEAAFQSEPLVTGIKYSHGENFKENPFDRDFFFEFQIDPVKLSGEAHLRLGAFAYVKKGKEADEFLYGGACYYDSTVDSLRMVVGDESIPVLWKRTSPGTRDTASLVSRPVAGEGLILHGSYCRKKAGVVEARKTAGEYGAAPGLITDEDGEKPCVILSFYTDGGALLYELSPFKVVAAGEYCIGKERIEITWRQREKLFIVSDRKSSVAQLYQEIKIEVFPGALLPYVNGYYVTEWADNSHHTGNNEGVIEVEYAIKDYIICSSVLYFTDRREWEYYAEPLEFTLNETQTCLLCNDKESDIKIPGAVEGETPGELKISGLLWELKSRV